MKLIGHFINGQKNEDLIEDMNASERKYHNFIVNDRRLADKENTHYKVDFFKFDHYY